MAAVVTTIMDRRYSAIVVLTWPQQGERGESLADSSVECCYRHVPAAPRLEPSKAIETPVDEVPTVEAQVSIQGPPVERPGVKTGKLAQEEKIVAPVKQQKHRRWRLWLSKIKHKNKNKTKGMMLEEAEQPLGVEELQVQSVEEDQILEPGDYLFDQEKLWKKEMDEENNSHATSCTAFDDESWNSEETTLTKESWMSGATEKRCNSTRPGDVEIETDMEDGDGGAWVAAKRGDLVALEYCSRNQQDWTKEDDFGNTPLYYGCHSGAARNLWVVYFLLKTWPSSREAIPSSILDRCKRNVINPTVVHLLENPERAEEIVIEANGR